jgi:anti-anti-sigma factor
MVQSPRILLIDTEEVTFGVTKINLRGRLDSAGVQAIETTFGKLARTQSQLIVDLSRVSFIASTGLRTLITASRAVAANGGRMVFLQPEPSVESVLIGSGTDRIVPICRSLPDAVQAVSLDEIDDDDFPASSLSFTLQVDRTQSGIKRAGAWVDELAILINLSSRTEYALRLCLEEAVTNIVTHGEPGPGPEPDVIGLRLVAEPSRLSITIQDHCTPRNPLLATDAEPTEAGAGEPGEGGLGIGLIRQHARDVAWSRVGQVNRLAMAIPR